MKDKYIILTSTTPEWLQKKVNYEIEQGYVPIGGVAISKTLNSNNSLNAQTLFCQSMILNK